MGKKKYKNNTKKTKKYTPSHVVRSPQVNQAAYAVFGSLYYNPHSD